MMYVFNVEVGMQVDIIYAQMMDFKNPLQNRY